MFYSSHKAVFDICVCLTTTKVNGNIQYIPGFQCNPDRLPIWHQVRRCERFWVWYQWILRIKILLCTCFRSCLSRRKALHIAKWLQQFVPAKQWRSKLAKALSSISPGQLRSINVFASVDDGRFFGFVWRRGKQSLLYGGAGRTAEGEKSNDILQSKGNAPMDSKIFTRL